MRFLLKGRGPISCLGEERAKHEPDCLGLATGAAVTYWSSRAMDRATGWYLERQSEASKRREEELVSN